MTQKLIKTPYPLTAVNSSNMHEVSSRKIKPLILKLIHIGNEVQSSGCYSLYRDGVRKFDDRSYRRYRKKGYSKVQSIQVCSNETIKEYDRRILLMLAKKTKSYSSLQVRIHNNQIMRMGCVSSRLKQISTNVDTQSIELLRNSLKVVQKAKGLKRIFLDTTSKQPVTAEHPRTEFFKHLFRILQGHPLDYIKIILRSATKTLTQNLNLLEVLMKKVKILSFYEISSEWECRFIHRVVDKDQSQTRFNFTARGSLIKWEAFKSNETNPLGGGSRFDKAQGAKEQPELPIFSRILRTLQKMKAPGSDWISNNQTHELLILIPSLKLNQLQIKCLKADKLCLEDLSMVEQLRPNIQDCTIECEPLAECIPCFKNTNKSMNKNLLLKYYYRTKILGSASQVDYRFRTMNHIIKWKGFKNNVSSRSPEDSLTFCEKYLESSGDFRNLRKHHLLSQKGFYHKTDPLTLAKLFETIQDMTPKTTIPISQDIMNQIVQDVRIMASKVLLDFVNNKTSANSITDPLACNIYGFLDNFSSLIRSQTYFCNNITFEAEHLAELSIFIKKVALKAIEILHVNSNNSQTHEQIVKLFEPVVGDFHKNKTELVKSSYRHFYTNEEISFLKLENISKVLSIIEQMSEDVRKQFYPSYGGNSLQEALNRMMSNLYTIILSQTSVLYSVTELAIESFDLNQNVKLATSPIIMNAPKLVSFKSLKILSFHVPVNQKHPQFLNDLERLACSLPQLETLRLYIWISRRLQVIRKNSGYLEGLSTEKYTCDEIVSMPFISGVSNLVTKLGSLNRLDVLFMVYSEEEELYHRKYIVSYTDELNDQNGLLLKERSKSLKQFEANLLDYEECYVLGERFDLKNYANSFDLLESIQKLVQSSTLRSLALICNKFKNNQTTLPDELFNSLNIR